MSTTPLNSSSRSLVWRKMDAATREGDDWCEWKEWREVLTWSGVRAAEMVAGAEVEAGRVGVGLGAWGERGS